MQVRDSLHTTEVILTPRYPLYGGWKAEFTLGYSLPLEVCPAPKVMGLDLHLFLHNCLVMSCKWATVIVGMKIRKFCCGDYLDHIVGCGSCSGIQRGMRNLAVLQNRSHAALQIASRQ